MTMYDAQKKDAAQVTPEAAHPTGGAGWLVMIYLAGDNNLTEEMVFALEDMHAEGAPPGVKIVVQFDPSGIGLFSQRYDLTKPGRSLEERRIHDFESAVNTGEPQALVDFARWALDRYKSPNL